MKDSTLSIMLLTQLAEKTFSSRQESIDSDNASTTSSTKEGKEYNEARNIFTAFTDVLVQCNTMPEALAHAFIPIFDR